MKNKKIKVRELLNSVEMEEARQKIREVRAIKIFKANEKRRLKVKPRPYEIDRSSNSVPRFIFGRRVHPVPPKPLT